jgi:hypothetical protein
LWDGYVNADKVDESGDHLPQYAICVDNGDAEVLNVDLGNGGENMVVGALQHSCRHTSLPPIELTAPL